MSVVVQASSEVARAAALAGRGVPWGDVGAYRAVEAGVAEAYARLSAATRDAGRVGDVMAPTLRRWKDGAPRRPCVMLRTSVSGDDIEATVTHLSGEEDGVDWRGARRARDGAGRPVLEAFRMPGGASLLATNRPRSAFARSAASATGAVVRAAWSAALREVSEVVDVVVNVELVHSEFGLSLVPSTSVRDRASRLRASGFVEAMGADVQFVVIAVESMRFAGKGDAEVAGMLRARGFASNSPSGALVDEFLTAATGRGAALALPAPRSVQESGTASLPPRDASRSPEAEVDGGVPERAASVALPRERNPSDGRRKAARKSAARGGVRTSDRRKA